MLSFLNENKLLIAIVGAAVVVLGGMIGLVTGSAWFVVLALALHLVATFFVATFAIRLSSEVDKPDPVTVARLEAEGVRDPEKVLNDSIRSGEAERQAEEITPSSVPTTPVGPGSEESLHDRAA